MKLVTATIGVLMLAACDSRSCEEAALRSDLAAKETLAAQLNQEVTRLRAELARERQKQAREAFAQTPIVMEEVEEVEEALPPRVNLVFPPASKVDAKGITCAANRCKVPRRTLDALLADRIELAQAARVLPHLLQDGSPQGLNVYGIRPGGVFHTIGLRNGDIVRTLGGQEVGTGESVQAAYAAIKDQRTWTIAGVRKMAPFELTIVVTE